MQTISIRRLGGYVKLSLRYRVLPLIETFIVISRVSNQRDIAIINVMYPIIELKIQEVKIDRNKGRNGQIHYLNWRF